MNSEAWKNRLYESYVSTGVTISLDIGPEQYFAPRAPYVRYAIRRFLPAERSVEIMDLGCGPGAYVYFLRKMGFESVHGIDISAEQVKLAQQFDIEGIRQEDIRAYLTSEVSASKDVVLLIDILEHFDRAGLLEVLDGVCKIMRPGGRCVAHVPNAEGLYGMHVRYGDLTHEMAFTPSSVRQIFRATGFCDIRCFEDKPIVHGIPSFARRVIWSVGTLLPRLLLTAELGSFSSSILSQNMMIIARK